jgi:hypothetical protein
MGFSYHCIVSYIQLTKSEIMKKATTFILLSLFCSLSVLVFTQCKKKVIKVDENYVGFWEGYEGTTAHILDIQKNSKGRYEKSGAGVTETANGTVRLKDDKLKVGPFKKFEVRQHPVKKVDQNGQEYWEMNLDGVRFIRY